MADYLMAVVLAGTTVTLSLILVSKKRHCENVANLALYLMFFMCIISIQPAGIRSQGVFVFCGLVMAGCLGGFFYGTFGRKTIYFIKDLDLSLPDHLEQIQVVLKGYVRENLPLTARVNLEFRVLTIQGATEDQRQGCLAVINRYMNEHDDCSNMKDWQWMIRVAAGILVAAMVVQAIYYLLR